MPLQGKIDFRSDTFTQPTDAMRHAMFESVVGDDVWGLDPTVNELEQLAAKIFGKDAALFLPSTCMGNLIAVMAHTSGRGDEILVGDKAHISLYEQGGVSTIGGVHVRTLSNKEDGTFDVSELVGKIRPNNVHFPKTALVCLESTHNMCGGSVLEPSFIDSVASIAAPLGIKLHLDGARVFNALTYLKLSPAGYVARFDSISICLSKGLGAPVGSLLIGGKQFIDSSRRLRKALGGGMRQAGVIACCGRIALTDMVARLEEDHANASLLCSLLMQIPGISSTAPPQTNIVKFAVNGVDLNGFCMELEKHNVYMITVDEGRAVRAVMHYHIIKEDVVEAARVVEDIMKKISNGQIVIRSGSRVY